MVTNRVHHKWTVTVQDSRGGTGEEDIYVYWDPKAEGAAEAVKTAKQAMLNARGKDHGIQYAALAATYHEPEAVEA
jgi:hypothetical protein